MIACRTYNLLVAWLRYHISQALLHARHADMPLCNSTVCGSFAADLKCARCQGVFYCNQTCQKADWRRHKPYCKPLPSSAPGKALAQSGQMRLARVSTSEVDDELRRMVLTFVQQARAVSQIP